MCTLRSIVAVAFLVLAMTASADAAPNSAVRPGTLDPGFGHNGIAPIAIPGRDFPIGMATANDGAVVVLGNPEYGSTWRIEDDCGGERTVRGVTWQLTRYRRDGRVMSSFGRHGKVVQHFEGDSSTVHYSYPTTVFAQPDGKIVVAGLVDLAADNLPAGARKSDARTSDQDCEPGISIWKRQVAGAVRFMPDGRRDRSYGKNGVGVLGAHVLGDAIAALDKQGGLVLTGNVIGRSSGFMARLTAAGRPDTAFGENGRVRLNTSPSSLAVDRRGRILAAAGNRIWRFDKHGKPDASFGANGELALGKIALKEVVPTADGLTLLYSQVSSGHSRVGIAKLDESGGALPTFGAGGSTDLGEGAAESLFIDTTGRAVVAWTERAKSLRRWRVSRLSASGALDQAFDTSGGGLVFDSGSAPKLLAGPSRYGTVVVGRSGTKPNKPGRSQVLARLRN